MPEEYLVSITSIARDAVVERFDDALAKVVENILDPNTKAEADRKIVIEVTLKPNESRSMAATLVKCDVKTVGPRALETALYVGRKNGHPAATEYNPDQPSIFDLEKDYGNANDKRDGKSRGAGND